jgi:hypothetical protein
VGAVSRIVPISSRIEVAVPIAKWFSRRTLLRTVGLSVAALLPAGVAAQVVRGTVVDEASGRAMPGIVVVLLDSTGKRLAGVLAGDDGRYAIRIAMPGRFAVRAERIGYRADAPTPVVLKSGETVELRLVTRPIPVMLSAVRVIDKSPCVSAAADGREVSTVWDETRKALYATDLTQREELFSARVSRFQRTLDAESGRVMSHETTQGSGVTRNPFVSLPAAQLSANGYVRQNSTETIYYGPDAGVLLSDEFLRDHCFRLRNGAGRRNALIGLAFEPARGRDKPDIAGTLWIDRRTAELRDLEYEYRQLPNLPISIKSEDFGGRVTFHRMPTGAWIVERWVIRMPVLVDRGPLARRTESVVPGTAPVRVDRVQLAAIREEGGEVVETVARGARREVATEVASVRGSVFDSTRMLPLRDARVFLDGTQFSARSGDDGAFTIAQVPPGTYALSVAHARFDSLNVRAPSATVTLRSGEESASHLAAPSVETILSRDCASGDRAGGVAALRGRVRDVAVGGPAIDARVVVTWNRLGEFATDVVKEIRSETRTDSAGRYDFCGLPDGVRLTARATLENRHSAPLQVVLPPRELSVLDIVVGSPTVVVTDAMPKDGAAVVRGNALGNQAMRDFERRRRRGAGVYVTRVQIDRLHASRLTDVLRTLPGVSVAPDQSGGLVVELRRSRQYTFDLTAGARSDSASQSMPAQVSGPVTVKKCPAGFLLDGFPIDAGGTVDAEVRPDMIAAIEVYAGGQVPIEFAARNSDCGLVMIWTRAFADRSDPVPGRDGSR